MTERNLECSASTRMHGWRQEENNDLSSETLVLWALLPLLAGVVLQLLAARFLSARAKGVLALVCCLPSLAAVVATFVRSSLGGPIDFNAMPWDGPLALVFHVDALSLMFAAMGTGLGLDRSALLDRLYGPRPRGNTLLCLHAYLHLRHGGPGL